MPSKEAPSITPTGSVLCSATQAVPFQRVVRGVVSSPPVGVLPTVVQAVAEVQETAFRVPPEVPGGWAALCGDQELPSQRSSLRPSLTTATQKEAEGQETPARLVGGSAIDAADQELPSNRRARAWGFLPSNSSMLVRLAWPTAQHWLAEAQETEARKLLGKPAALGEETIDQVEPFQRSIRVETASVPVL